MGRPAPEEAGKVRRQSWWGQGAGDPCRAEALASRWAMSWQEMRATEIER